MRIGLGHDVHAFVEGRPLVLGGVVIPYELGLIGHSDADVLTHALIDAILGAMRLGDLGEHFPDTDAAYKDISSLVLLDRARELMERDSFTLVDADCVLVLEQPKIAPYREEMRANLAEHLRVPVEAIGVKATSTEGLGFTGRQEGVGAHAVVLLEQG